MRSDNLPQPPKSPISRLWLLQAAIRPSAAAAGSERRISDTPTIPVVKTLRRLRRRWLAAPVEGRLLQRRASGVFDAFGAGNDSRGPGVTRRAFRAGRPAEPRALKAQTILRAVARDASPPASISWRKSQPPPRYRQDTPACGEFKVEEGPAAAQNIAAPETAQVLFGGETVEGRQPGLPGPSASDRPAASTREGSCRFSPSSGLQAAPGDNTSIMPCRVQTVGLAAQRRRAGDRQPGGSWLSA